jgi:hypothetical protein
MARVNLPFPQKRYDKEQVRPVNPLDEGDLGRIDALRRIGMTVPQILNAFPEKNWPRSTVQSAIGRLVVTFLAIDIHNEECLGSSRRYQTKDR